jgi:TetR/AcrR family transcriptional regulator
VPPSKPRRSPKPQERRRDPERTRKLILDAASAEFGAHGYAGARISAIASRAGVNQQLISYYFDGKEGLVPPGTSLPEQLRRHALEALHNPEGVRLLVMLMAAAMATTTLPHVIELARLIGLEPA